MRRYIWKRGEYWVDGKRWTGLPTYKCAGGCGGRVDRPETTCLKCVLDEMNAENAREANGERPLPAA